MQTQTEQWKTDPVKWLEAQPELIDCKRGLKMRPSSCLAYLAKHYGLVQTIGCAGKGCRHYIAPEILPKMNIQPMVTPARARTDTAMDLLDFLQQSSGIRAALEKKQDKQVAKSKAQSDYEARRAAGKAKRQKQDRERVGKQALARKMKTQGKTFQEIADAVGVHANTVKRWTYEGPGRAGIFKEKEKIRREERKENADA